MWIGVVTLFPEMLEVAVRHGVFGRAVADGVLEVATFNPRDFATDRHRTVDDRPYGGGPGMVLMVEPLASAVGEALDNAPAPAEVVLLSPQGQVFRQADALAASRREALVLVCGRYEGVDERFVAAHVKEEWSIGDYVVSGGELPAMVVMDAIARHLPGTLGNAGSAGDESHLDGLLDYPHYTRPETGAVGRVPPDLLSGDHASVARYRRREALRRTLERRPDLLTGRTFGPLDRELLQDIVHDLGVSPKEEE